ncbi:MAG TPA: hypothetical protein VIR01_19645 [Pyrinomonadaceae bacterium]|jgi:hypothetical protein
MRHSLLPVLLMLLLAASTMAQTSVSSESQPVKISSLNTPFAVQAQFSGRFKVYSSGIALEFEKSRITISENCPYKGRRLITRLRVGLATRTEKGWKLVNSAPAIAIQRVLKANDSIDLGELKFLIPLTEHLELSDHWFVVQIDETSLDGDGLESADGVSFAHSDRKIFTRLLY